MEPRMSTEPLEVVESAEDKSIDEFDGEGVRHKINAVIDSQWSQ
jgi:hypothetical protein